MRKRSGLTQRDLAAALGQSHAGYTYYESDRFKREHLPAPMVSALMQVLPGRGEPPIEAREIAALSPTAPTASEQVRAAEEAPPPDPRRLMEELDSIDRQTCQVLRSWLAAQPDAPPEIVRLMIQADTRRKMIARTFAPAAMQRDSALT